MGLRDTAPLGKLDCTDWSSKVPDVGCILVRCRPTEETTEAERARSDCAEMERFFEGSDEKTANSVSVWNMALPARTHVMCTSIWQKRALGALLLMNAVIGIGTAACGSSDDSGQSGLVTANGSSGYTPATPPSSPPLPPGAGPRDASLIIRDTSTPPKDVAAQDAAVITPDAGAAMDAQGDSAPIGDATGQ
jgi:hypothetical protein